MRYRPKRPSRARIEAERSVVELSLEHPELGSDKIGSMARRRGHRISLVDEYTCEVHALYVDRHIGANKLIDVLGKVMEEQGAPANIHSDNCPEFIASALQSWLARTG